MMKLSLNMVAIAGGLVAIGNSLYSVLISSPFVPSYVCTLMLMGGMLTVMAGAIILNQIEIVDRLRGQLKARNGETTKQPAQRDRN